MQFNLFPSLSGKVLVPAATSDYPTVGVDFFDEPEQKIIRDFVGALIEPKNFDFDNCVTLIAPSRIVINGLFEPKVWLSSTGLSLKVGNNLIDLVYDKKKSQWIAPSGRPLMLGSERSEQDKIDYPIFQLDLGEQFYKFKIAWVSADDLSPVKNNLRGLLIPLSEELKKYVAEYATIPAPLYSLLQAGKIDISKQHPDQLPLATYRITDVKATKGKFGMRYMIKIDPTHRPQQTLYGTNGMTFDGSWFDTQNVSKDYLSANFDQMKADLDRDSERRNTLASVTRSYESLKDNEEPDKESLRKAEKVIASLKEDIALFEYWLIMQGVRVLPNGKLSCEHVLFKGAIEGKIKEFRPSLDPNYRVLKAQDAPALNYDNNPL